MANKKDKMVGAGHGQGSDAGMGASEVEEVIPAPESLPEAELVIGEVTDGVMDTAEEVAGPVMSKRQQMLFRTALDLLPGWVGAFKDDYAKKDPDRPPTDEEIAASIVAGVASFEDKDEQWKAIHP